MKVSKIKINGIENPIGYYFDSIRCSWIVTNTTATKTEFARIDVSKSINFQEIVFHKEGSNLNSACEPLEIPLEPYTRYYVRVQVDNNLQEKSEGISFFETAKRGEKWKANWIKPQTTDKFHPVFEKEFETIQKVVSARLYISGLGLYSVFLNDKKIGGEILTPYFSDYNTDVQYQTYDIKEYLKSKNVIRIELGNGWYKGFFGLEGKDNNYGSEFQTIAEIKVQFEDQTETVIATDDSWVYYGSDTENSDIYNGEIVNRLLWEGKENQKKKPVIGNIKGKLIERYSLPVIEHEEMKVKELIHTPAGEIVLDFGQNFAGYVQFRSSFPKGTKITLDYGEILQNGNFYNDNYRSAKAHFIYVSNGKEEIVKPQFTYYGFRYVRVSGTENVNKDDFVGKALYSTMDLTGHIETGNEKVNKLFSNVLWGQKSNFIDFPTDCPQRDERLGWTGDGQVFSGTACYNMYTPSFYNKFIHDLRVEQKKLDGIMPGVIPVLDTKMVSFAAVWGDIATFLPTVLYERYGDKIALDSYYPMMKDWVDKIRKQDQSRGKERYLFDYGMQFGDWVALDGRTSQSFKGGTDDYFIASCYYAMSAKMVGDAAKILGKKDEEVSYYYDLHDKIKDAVLREYFTETGRLSIDTQTGFIVSLYSGIYRNKERIISGLKERLYKDCYKIKGGFVGAPIMCKVMADNGLIEEAFYFLLNERFPGWIHCINLGATTVWERWNSVLDDGLISGTKMNSLNHYAFGSVVEFLYRNVAGLRPIEPAFKKASIKPAVNSHLRFFKCSYESAHGLYRVEWKINKDGDIDFLIEIPIDCSAVVELPFYPNNEKMELITGVHEFHYKPTQDVKSKYSKQSLFYDMVDDEQAMNVIKKISPMLFNILKSGDVDCLYENLETLKEMFFLGFTPEMIKQLTKELTSLSDF